MTARHSVLIVEDDNDLRRMFVNTLRFADFDVREAADGRAALIQIDQQRPAMIVLDLGLPNIDGYGVLRELAAHAQTRNIPVIVVTGEHAPPHTEGMTCLLRKPVAPDRLVNTVRACLTAGVSPKRL